MWFLPTSLVRRKEKKRVRLLGGDVSKAAPLAYGSDFWASGFSFFLTFDIKGGGG